MSVDRATVHMAAGRGPEALLTIPVCDDRWGVLEITVAACVGLEFEVIEDPIEGNQAHALIVPPPSSGQSKKLTAAARWAITPPIAG